MKIRGKLLLALSALALLAVAGMAAGGYAVLHARAEAQARESFAASLAIVDRALVARYRLLTQIANLSYVDPVIRSVTGGATDAADFGLDTTEGDAENLRELHQNLVDASWDWSAASSEGTFAIADYKGRVLYAHAAPSRWGGDASVLPAVAQALGDPRQGTGTMLARAADERLRALGLVSDDMGGLVVVLARAEVLRGRPRAVFIQVLPAERLLADAALGRARVSLVADDGEADGAVPPAAIEAARARMAVVSARVDGSTWLAQSAPLHGPDRERRIGTVVVAQDLDAALAEMTRPALLPLALVALALLGLAVLGASMLARRMTRPIEALDVAARLVAGGDLGAAVPAPAGAPRDEIDGLGRSFNTMLEGLRERERVKTTFKKYLAPDVVDYLLAHPEAQELGGTRRELTVMFSDLVHFTSLAEARAPEEVVTILNRYFTRVSERIAARGGTVDKYIGDAVMAFFGAPVPRQDHAARACLAALDHLAVVDELGGEPIAVRIGINTGEMIVGNIGGGAAQDYTVIGDAVNLAQRVEGANREYGTRLLVTDAARLAAGSAIDARELDRVILPGRARAVVLHEVLGPAGFLDGSPPHRESAQHYAEGLEALRARGFLAAVTAFDAALAARPDDGPARVLRARAERFATTPPPEGWDGTHRMAK